MFQCSERKIWIFLGEHSEHKLRSRNYCSNKIPEKKDRSPESRPKSMEPYLLFWKNCQYCWDSDFISKKTSRYGHTITFRSFLHSVKWSSGKIARTTTYCPSYNGRRVKTQRIPTSDWIPKKSGYGKGGGRLSRVSRGALGQASKNG